MVLINKQYIYYQYLLGLRVRSFLFVNTFYNVNIIYIYIYTYITAPSKVLPDIIFFAESFSIPDEASVVLVQRHLTFATLQKRHEQISYRETPAGLTLRQAACHERSGDTRSINWSWMRPPHPTQVLHQSPAKL